MTTYAFDGISTEQYNEQDRELFLESYSGTLIERKPFKVELDDKEVELHIFIEDTDMADYGDTTDHYITLGVVPAFKSLTKENQDRLLSQFTQEDRERMLANPDYLLQDALDYGFSIPLHTVTVSPDEVEHTIKSAIAVRFGVSGLIGFELDRPRNRLGSTGWDSLSDYCEGVDLLNATLARYA